VLTRPTHCGSEQQEGLLQRVWSAVGLGGQAEERKLSAEQEAALAARKREKVAAREVGPPPQAPQPPQGEAHLHCRWAFPGTDGCESIVKVDSKVLMVAL
jgi:hypothetical protein